MTKALIGAFSLNVSLVLYFTSYLPQLRHNQKGQDLKHLSLPFHFMLLTDYLLDLLYGFSLDLPWQYKLVSWTGLLYLMIQHRQLFKLHKKNILSNEVLLLMLSVIIGLYFMSLKESVYLLIGWMVQIFNIGFYFPQIIKNLRNQKAARSLSISFLSLHLLSVTLDNISAWCLNWPMPSKVGAAMVSLLTITLFIQRLAFA